MKAQAYYDDPKQMILRIFPTDGNYGIADLPLNAATPDAADHALRQMRLCRNSAWKRTGYGREALVYFRTFNTTPHRSGGAGGNHE